MFTVVGRKAGDDENFIAKIKAEKNLTLFLGFQGERSKAEAGRFKRSCAGYQDCPENPRLAGRCFGRLYG